MKLEHEKISPQSHIITHYEPGTLTIQGQRYTQNMVLSPQHIAIDWPCTDISQLNEAACQALLALQPEVIIIGTGLKLRFPPIHALRPLVEAGIGYEIMDTRNACATFNVLLTEGRQVVAGLILNENP